MKKSHLTQSWFAIATILFCFQFSSCNPDQKFKVELEEKASSFTKNKGGPVISIADYSVVMSDKGVSNFRFSVTTGDKFVIKNMNATQITALFAAMDRKSVKYDTVNHEFRSQGVAQPTKQLEIKVDSLLTLVKALKGGLK